MPKATQSDLVTRDYTINLHKRLHKSSAFKGRAPRAIREIKEFARDMMQTADVRVDDKLNKAIWAQGVRNPPKRIRVRLMRRRNEDDEAEDKLYTLVEKVDVPGFKGLMTETVE